MSEIKIIDVAHKKDIHIKNEHFQVWGRMVPSYENKKWSYTICKFAPQDVRQMCFPDENYRYEEISKSSIFIGAYEKGKCIGLAIIQDAFFKYMYLYDLKVNKAYRKQGVANRLIKKAKEIACSRGYHGIYTKAQDNNLSACLFLSIQVSILEVWIQRFIKEQIRKTNQIFCFIWIVNNGTFS